MFGGSYQGKRVWVSGHTGFKGPWLAEWLLQLGAEVHGYALAPEPHQRLYHELGLDQRITHTCGDIRDAAVVARSLAQAQPDFVFHLAAQALVRESYLTPAETYATNVTGTVHVLEALRSLSHPCAAVIVTSDKCYANPETGRAFREDDALGGADPYSSSKAAVEIALHAWRRSFLQNHPVRLASARAGNVLGGGDQAVDRIVPDAIRALRAGRPVAVRNPAAVRPWQHVLEPLGGYLWLAARLAASGDPALQSPFNFGPAPGATRTVQTLVEEMLHHWPGTWIDAHTAGAPPESHQLQLCTDKARAVLGWQAAWDFPETVARTMHWYRQAAAGAPGEPGRLCRGQIADYTTRARALGLAWAGS